LESYHDKLYRKIYENCLRIYGELVEWPEVVSEGKDLEDCRTMLSDALNEMVLAYNELGKEIPLGNALIEQLPEEVEGVGQAT
jgi:predicted RNase H-like HicB family nuclease